MAFGKNAASKNTIFALIRRLLAGLFLLYLRLAAKTALLFSKARIIGIAGAVGKSTTRNALYSILKTKYSVLVVNGNSETGVPLGLLGISPGLYQMKDFIRITVSVPFSLFTLRNFDYVIVELGIDGPFEPKNMSYLLKIVSPDIAVLLSESLAHSQNYELIIPNTLRQKSLSEQESYVVQYLLEDDGKLITQNTSAKTVFADATDSAVYEFVKKNTSAGQLYTVGYNDIHDIVIHHHEISLQGTRFDFSIHTHQQKSFVSINFSSVALPKQTGANIGTAILTGIHLGIDIEHIKESLENDFAFPSSRVNLLKGINNSTIIDSSYNASPASVIAFLSLMNDLKKKEKLVNTAVLGDMKELGIFSEYGHMQVAKALPGTIDQLLLIGPLTKQFILPYVNKHEKHFSVIMWFETIHELSRYLKEHTQKNSILLFKGSQTLEEAVKSILLKKEDRKKLCRQDAFWETSKRKLNIWID